MRPKIIEEFMKNAKITVDENMETHENDPFFVKQAEEMAKHLERCKLPEVILERMRKNSIKEKAIADSKNKNQ